MSLKHRLPIILALTFCCSQSLFFAGEEAPAEEKAPAVDVGKKNWIDIELEFASKLSLPPLSYNELAEKLIEEVKAGKGYDDQPLGGTMLTYLRGKLASNRIKGIDKLETIAEKFALADSAIKELKEIRDSLPKGGALQNEATIELIDANFRLAEIFRKENDKTMFERSLKGGVEEAAKGEDAYMIALKALAAERAKLAQLKRNRRARKQQVEAQEVKVKSAQAAANKLAAEAGLANQAIVFIQNGMELGNPLVGKLVDEFFDALDVWETAEDKDVKAKAMLKAQSTFMRRVKLQHTMERAYANWGRLLKRDDSRLQKVVEKGTGFMDEQSMDYESYLPADKQVYMHWIVMLSCLDDPLGEVDKEGKPLPKVDKEYEELGDFNRYLWPSVRMKFFFEHHFVKKPGQGIPPTSDGHKIKGLDQYAEALMRMGLGALEKADRVDADKKKLWLEHGAQLLAEAKRMMDELVKAESHLFDPPLKIDQTTRLTTRLKLRTEMAMRKALFAKSKNNTDKARESLAEALDEANQVLVTGGSMWRWHAEQAIQKVNMASQAWGIPIVSAAMYISEGNELMRKSRTEVIEAKRNALLQAANEKYGQALALSTGNKKKTDRAGTNFSMLSKIGSNALRMGDFMTGYIANFEVVQEFGPAQYPRNKFPEMERNYNVCLRNLRYAAGRLRRTKDTRYYQRLYVDALLLNIARQEDSGGGNPDVVVTLINELKGLGLYDSAIEYIDQVPKDHVYYRTVLLMAAAISQKQVKEYQSALNKLPDPAKPDPKKPLPAGEALENLKVKRADLLKKREDASAQAVAFSKRFIKEMTERPKKLPATATQQEKDIYAGETTNLPAAYMIPISISFSANKYGEVMTMVEGFAAQLNQVEGIKEEDKIKNLSTAYYLAYISSLRVKDIKTIPEADVEAQFKIAEAWLTKLESVDKLGERKNQGYLLQGASWNNLGNRYEQAMAKPDADKGALKTKLDQARLSAVNYFAKAEGAIYEQLSLLGVIVRIYADQGMYDKVVEITGDGIQYWGESLFTKAYVLAPKKAADAVTGASLSAAATNALKATGALAAIKKAADKESLAKALNLFITKANPTAEKEAFAGLLKSDGADEELAANISQAQKLLERPDLKENREIRHRVNRVVLEALYPEALVRSALMPVVPTEDDFAAAIKGFDRKYPASDNGRLKATLMRMFHDPTMLLGSTERKTVESFKQKLKGELENASSTQRKRDLQKLITLFDYGLRVRTYGIIEKGKIQKRSFQAAMRQIDGLLLFDKMYLPMSEPEVQVVPTKPFLEELNKALDFNQQIFLSQKRYIDALLATGKQDEALKYLQKLTDYYPNDKTLRIKRAEAESAKGASFAESKTYGQEQASLFMKARMRTIDIYKQLNKTSKGAKSWFDARLLIWQNEYNEITVRKAAGKTEVDFETPWLRKDRSGKMVTVGMKTVAKLDDQVATLWKELRRFKKNPPTEGTMPKSLMGKVDGMMGGLQEMGFKAPGRGKIPDAEKEPATQKGDEDTEKDENK